MNGEKPVETVESAPQAIIKRGAGGRFLKGTKAALGNKNPERSRHVTWRQAFMRAMTVKDVLAAVDGLRVAVKAGEAWAIKELLDRTLGKADQRLEVTGDGGGPVETHVTLRLKFADRSLLINEPPLLESDNGQRRTTSDEES